MFQELSSFWGAAMSLTPLPLPLPGNCTSGAFWGIFFALPAMNGPLPAEQKFSENTG